VFTGPAAALASTGAAGAGVAGVTLAGAGGWDNPLGADYGWMTWAKATKLLHITA
jgi:hypothetical protein